MLQKTRGVVLHVIKYNDSSNIVDVYTEALGKVSFLVKRPRTKKSAVKSVLFQPFCVVELDVELRPTSGLHRVNELKPWLVFSSIPYHPYKSAIALFLSEFLYRALREEGENKPLFEYLLHSIEWLDACEDHFANFHLVFLMRFSRFLGLYPNTENYARGCFFDLRNACFCAFKPPHHAVVAPEEAYHLLQLTRMNYETMHLFAMNRLDRNRCLAVINEYYRLHLPDFPVLKSLEVLSELFG